MHSLQSATPPSKPSYMGNAPSHSTLVLDDCYHGYSSLQMSLMVDMQRHKLISTHTQFQMQGILSSDTSPGSYTPVQKTPAIPTSTCCQSFLPSPTSPRLIHLSNMTSLITLGQQVHKSLLVPDVSHQIV